MYRFLGENLEVLIALPDVSSAVPSVCPSSEANNVPRPDTCSPVASERCSSATSPTVSSSSWTTELTVPRLPRTSVLPRGKKTNHLKSFYLTRAFVRHYRLRIVNRCRALNVRVTNAQAKLRKVSNEWDGRHPTLAAPLVVNKSS